MQYGQQQSYSRSRISKPQSFSRYNHNHSRSQPTPRRESQSYSQRRESQSQSHSHRRPQSGRTVEYLDQWNPLSDRNHYQKIDQWRKRKQPENLGFRKDQRAKFPFGSSTCTSTSTSSSASKGNVNEGGRLRSNSSSSFSSSSLSRSEETPDTNIILKPSTMSQTFSQELSNYKSTSTSNPNPTPPHPRSRALRVSGAEFSAKIARDLKSWSHAQGLLYGQNTASLRDTDRLHLPSEYTIGTIFSAPHHAPGHGGDDRWVSVTDPHNTATPFGVVYSKYRKMIVAKTFAEHCVCVPVYSHRGRGLDGKRGDCVDEYVSIRDVADRDPLPVEGNTRFPLLAVGNQGGRDGRRTRRCIISGRSEVKVSEMLTHRYATPATIEGFLDVGTDSIERLLDLVRMVSLC
ncbi:hypothetical protein GGS20DRAFT_477069 [Poronia punctata]|nr:hypothetical protein GGS20DRAFT_477069 [Poronia punctata]